MSQLASAESLRIVRTLDVSFSSGPGATGSAFVVDKKKLLTCAHVVWRGGKQAQSIRVRRPDGTAYEASVEKLNTSYDLALISADPEQEAAPRVQVSLPSVGTEVVFAGKPQGVRVLSVFPGMVSATGSGLLVAPRCEMIQVSGMINNGNSGGPLLDGESGEVLGIITAKYVPLLQEIDKLSDALADIPQFPSSVGIGDIDFSKFVNLTIRLMWQLAAVLRLIQVGIGWAVPSKYFNKVA